MRALGLDYGDARIGVAISDPLGWTASGLTTIARKNPIDLSTSISQIAEIVSEYQVGLVVLGYPKNMDGTEGENCKKVLYFKKKLERALGSTPIELYDERLTSKRANIIFAETNSPRPKNKGDVDKMAAAIILQDYLDLKSKEKKMDFDERNFDEEFDMEEVIEMETIIMTDEDGNEVEYIIIDEFEHNQTSYLIMVKAENAEDDEAEAAIFKQVSANEEEFVLEEISEEEYNELEEMLKARMAEFDIDIQ
ncbi:MAG: Holliday junction resolvase RuvX [Defluviitaleaceae bacterium]|nr:Holliday junction resolvase RuvX [Defluviitaleaceae bacterium]